MSTLSAPPREFSRALPWLAPIPRLELQPDPPLEIPDDETCRRWCDFYGVMPHIAEHSEKVADLAATLAARAAEKGRGGSDPDVSARLTRAGGLLHDIAKSYCIRHGGSHAQVGASWVVELTGDRRIAHVVLHHTEWPWELPADVCRAVFFVGYADKRVRHDRYVSLEERYADLLDRYGTSEESRTTIKAGRRRALELERALSAQLELPLDAYTFDHGRLVERA